MTDSTFGKEKDNTKLEYFIVPKSKGVLKD